MKKTLCILVMALVCVLGKAQHYQFSQFYAAPTYLNPAFTGANVCGRVNLNYRNQWSGIPGAYKTYMASYDHYLRTLKSGLGFQVFRDHAGVGAINTTQFSGLYAYGVRINRQIMARAGISAGFIQRNTDMGQFVFADQLRDGKSVSSEAGYDARASYMDLGTGVIVYSNFTWVGFSASHINRPNQSLMNGTSPLPPEFKLHGGYQFSLDGLGSSNPGAAMNNYVTVAANYKKQNKFNQVDAGLYYNKNIMVLGVWYRGIPVFKPEGIYENNDAIVMLLGILVGKYKIGYSYDYTLSKLTNATSKGAHEISMSFQFCKFKKEPKRKAPLISCPKF